MRVTLIHNPGAGRNAQSDALVAMLRAAGHEVYYQSARADNWPQALAREADLIAVAGGDGTLSRVAKRMLGRGVPLAPLPCGTANNIAHTLGIAGVALADLVRAWPEARRVRLNIGIAQGPWGLRRFVEGFGAGLFAWTMPYADASETIAGLQRTDAKIAYAQQMLKDRLEHCPPIALEARLDGQDLSGEYVLFEAMNIRYIGPNLYLAPEGEAGNGEFIVVAATERERARLHEYLSKWQEEKMRLPMLRSHRGRHLSLAWSGFAVHIDDQLWPKAGEPPGRTSGRIDVCLEPGGLEVLIPAGKPA